MTPEERDKLLALKVKSASIREQIELLRAENEARAGNSGQAVTSDG